MQCAVTDLNAMPPLITTTRSPTTSLPPSPFTVTTTPLTTTTTDPGHEPSQNKCMEFFLSEYETSWRETGLQNREKREALPSSLKLLSSLHRDKVCGAFSGVASLPRVRKAGFLHQLWIEHIFFSSNRQKVLAGSLIFTGGEGGSVAGLEGMLHGHEVLT